MEYRDKVVASEEIRELIDNSGRCLEAMSYTEHGYRHANYVAGTANRILKSLGYDEKNCDLAFIAGYLHDVGNCINRYTHGITGALLVYPILKGLGLDLHSVNLIISAIGNHEEEIGTPVNHVAAALIIADKSDAHRTRVSMESYDPEDIHDRVNFSIKKNTLQIDAKKKIISSRYYMNRSSSVMEYFEIYLARMTMTANAAKVLGCTFRLFINDVLINSPKNIDKLGDEKLEKSSL